MTGEPGTKWSPTTAGSTKTNSGATIFEGRGSGYGVVLVDTSGQVMVTAHNFF